MKTIHTKRITTMKTLILNIVVILFAVGYTPSLAQDTPCNCCTEEHKAFDFWIGSWEVTTPDGNSAGTNKITKVEGNCIIRENWISAKSGYTGSSTNFYNSESKQWEQLWIDNAGAHLKLRMEGNVIIE